MVRGTMVAEIAIVGEDCRDGDTFEVVRSFVILSLILSSVNK